MPSVTRARLSSVESGQNMNRSRAAQGFFEAARIGKTVVRRIGVTMEQLGGCSREKPQNWVKGSSSQAPKSLNGEAKATLRKILDLNLLHHKIQNPMENQDTQSLQSIYDNAVGRDFMSLSGSVNYLLTKQKAHLQPEYVQKLGTAYRTFVEQSESTRKNTLFDPAAFKLINP
jgi:hypothetical protein